MHKSRIRLAVFGLALLFLLFVLFPTANSEAHQVHHEEEFVDIIVRYEGEVPSEDELDPSFKNVRTSRNVPTRAMTVPSESIKVILEDPNVSQLRYNQEVTTAQDGAIPAEAAPSQTTSIEPEVSTSHSAPAVEETAQAGTDSEVPAATWNLETVQAPYAWSEEVTGAGVNIAVIDTGFYAEHPDITYAGGESLFEDDPWTNDHTGHGTHVSGIIGASRESAYPGVAPRVNLYGIKVYHEDHVNELGYPTTDVFNITEGIYEAMRFNPHIIVISSGFSGGDVDLHQAIQDAAGQEILVVAASGNGKPQVDFPAAYPEVLSVSSVSEALEPAGDIIPGEANDVAAPGVAITSLSSPDSLYGYPFATLSGSSQAAPHAAGVLALLIQRYGFSSSSARSMLQENAMDIGNPSLFGHGLVQYLTPEQRNQLHNSPEESPVEENTPTDENTENAPGPTSPEDEESSETQNQENPAENEEEQGLHDTVWINPDPAGTSSTIATEELNAVNLNGTLAVSVDSSMPDVSEIHLTAEQVNEITADNINLLITQNDMEWVIPGSNFIEGDAQLRFVQRETDDFSESSDALSSIYSFNIVQNGETQSSFDEPMRYRFLSEEELDVEEESIYVWNSENGWLLSQTSFKDNAVQTVVNHTGTLGTFPKEVFAETETDAEEPASIQETNENSSNDAAALGQESDSKAQSSAITSYSMIGLLVVTVIAAMIYFIKKQQSTK